ISEAPQNISFDAMAVRQRALGRVILQDQAVASISSFIGIDGTNTTLNSGRIQITLKPLAERGESVGDVISRLRPALAQVDGITLYLQPVQDLTVENRVSRTQFQYSLEDPDEAELRAWAPKFVARLRELPELHDVATDQLDQGLQARVQIDRTTREIGLPPSVQTGFQGAARAFQASLANQPLLILAAIVTVYIVLGVLYESWIHPITILSTLPSAGLGALLALLLVRLDLSVIALIGIILLIGIVMKNAIMMIDFALDTQRSQGRPAREAIEQASLLRFRPIIMTTMAALLGGVPLAFGHGVGSELREPLG